MKREVKGKNPFWSLLQCGILIFFDLWNLKRYMVPLRNLLFIDFWAIFLSDFP